MANCYVDTSALLKRFVQEDGAAEFDTFIAEFDGDLVISPLGLTEFASALQRRVRLREIPNSYALEANERLMDEITAGAWMIEPFDAMVFSQAVHAVNMGNMPLATMDALHLMIALQLAKRTGNTLMVTGDKQLAAAAKQANLAVQYFSKPNP